MYVIYYQGISMLICIANHSAKDHPISIPITEISILIHFKALNYLLFPLHSTLRRQIKHEHSPQ